MKAARTLFCLIFIVSNLIFAQEQKTQEQLDRELIEANLTNEINARYGEVYNIDFLDMKYTAGYREHINKYTFLDPYKTLEKCVLFTAERTIDAPDSIKGIMGVYKDGRILWETGPIVDDFLRFGGYLSTIDFNNDGKVEIVYSWLTNNVSEYIVYFIYSWDGNRGSFLSEISVKDYNTFIADIDGDKTIEICVERPLETETRNEEENPENEYGEIQYVPHGYFKCTGEFTEVNSFDLPKDRLNIYLNCHVEKQHDKYVYNYKLKNAKESYQEIESFYVKCPEQRDSLSVMFAPKNWSSGGTGQLDGWFIMYNHDYDPQEIKPGQDKDSFGIRTYYLPVISQYFVQGLNGRKEYEETRILNNSLKGFTLGQKGFIVPFILQNLLDTLLLETEKSSELGWIKETNIKDKYKSYLDSSRNLIQQKNSAEAGKYLQSILQDLDKDSSFSLSSEAYALLRYNTEYILSSLPETFKLNINIDGNGSIEKYPSQTEYDSSSAVALSAKPSGGNKFAGWSGDVTSSSDTITLVMNSIKNITAKFIPDIMPVGITSLSPGSGIEGAKALTLEIKGYGFLKSTVLNYNGIQRQIAFLSDSVIALVLNQSDLNRPGSIVLNAVNIDGGNSNAIIFRILSKTEASDTLISKLNKANETGQIKSRGTFNSLLKKLESFKKDFEKNNMNSAASATLKAFVNELEAQAGKAISETASDELKSFADLVLQSL